jgi:hypothetical protein
MERGALGVVPMLVGKKIERTSKECALEEHRKNIERTSNEHRTNIERASKEHRKNIEMG